MPAPARTIRRRRAPIPSARGGRAPSPRRRRQGPSPPPRGRAWTPRRDSTRARRPRCPAGSGRGSNPVRPARRWSSPSASSTSDGSVTGVAPSRISWLVPAAARFCTAPGTAITSIERSSASRAVVSDPPRSRLSTTTSTSASAARMRLRIGKRNFSGAVPGGHSDSSRPSAPTARHSSACWRGYGRSSPLATTPTAWPVPALLRAPRWAAPSMPLASPDTTTTSAAASSRPSVKAKSQPGPVALRVPTMPTRRRSRTSQLPLAKRTAGGCGIGTEQQRIVGIALAHGADAELGAPSGPGVRIALHAVAAPRRT